MYKRIRNVLCALTLSVMSLAPAIALPGIAHAATCDSTSQGGGAGGGLVTDGGESGAIDSATVKVSTELTPVTAWPATSNGFTSFVSLAKTDCTDAGVFVDLHIDGNHVLTASMYDSSHSAAYVQGTDFANGASGVTWASDSNNHQTMTYTIPTFPMNTAQLVSVDLSSPGFVNIYLKQGSGTDTLLGSMSLTSGVTKFLNTNGDGVFFFLDGTDQSWTKCSEVTAFEGKVRVLADGVAQAITVDANTDDTCPHLSQNSYDSTNKIVDFKTVTVAQSGVAEDAQFLLPTSTGSVFTNILTSTQTTTSSGTTYFTDFFTSTNTASQQLFFANYFTSDAQGYKANDEPIVASGTFDMSQGDIDASTVVFDTNKTTFAAVAHNFASLTKDKTFTLYVPYRDADKSVGICPGAANLAAVTTSCDKLYYIGDGQSKTSADAGGIPANGTVKAAIVTINGNKYWQVDGLTGTGGFSSTADPNVTAAAAPDTGFALVANKSFSTLAISTIAALSIAAIAHRLKPVSKR